MTGKGYVLILGATSSIARSIASCFAEKGYPLFLASREEADLKRYANDLMVKYHVDVKHGYFDATNFHTHGEFFSSVIQSTQNLEGVVVAFGDLGNHQKAIRHFDEAQKMINQNFVGACSILTYAANYFEKKKGGFIIGLSSVAGDRGRQSNYIYGAAKGGFETFLSGLRNRLFPSGVKVLTAKLGFVDTAMTYGLNGLFLVASPKDVAHSIVSALFRGRNTIYVPWFWREIMGIIKSIPEMIFKRLKL